MASWNKDKLVNMFVLKLTPLAKPLSMEVRRSCYIELWLTGMCRLPHRVHLHMAAMSSGSARKVNGASVGCGSVSMVYGYRSVTM